MPSYNAILGNEKYYDPLIKLTFNSVEGGLYYTMSRNLHLTKPIISTLIPNKRAFAEMKVERQVYDMFELVELDIARVMGESAHKKLTYEFVASFNRVHHGESFGRDTVWEFRIQNTNFIWTRDDAKKFLEFPLVGYNDTPTVELSNYFWTQLSGSEKFGAKESPFLMREGVWQIVHRLVATNINCQPESNDVVTLEDLELMWKINRGEALDWFKIFVQRFLSMKNMHGPRDFIGCTSLITLIAKCCGFKFTCIPFENRTLDIACWRRICLTARPTPVIDESEEHSNSEEESDPSEEAEEPARRDHEEESRAKKPKTKAEIKTDLLDRIDWAKLKEVVVFKF